MSRPRKRLTVGVLMLLILIAAFALWAVEYSRRTQVVFDNRSSSRVGDLMVAYAGQVRHLGPVEPRSKFVIRVPSPPGEPVRVSWEVKGTSGVEDHRIEAPAVTTSGAGGVVSVGWDG